MSNSGRKFGTAVSTAIALLIMTTVLIMSNAKRTENGYAEDQSKMYAATIENSEEQQNRTINEQRFDGKWWGTAARDEQQGFVAGYIDCYTYDVKGPTKSDARLFEYQVAVTTFYKEHPEQLETPLGQVLRNILRNFVTKYPAQSGGEVWDEPHGFFDGQWWKGAQPKEQVGYIEGYLWCYGNEMKQPTARFSKSAEDYVELITNYYSDQHTDHQDDKVAYVLCRFRD